LVVSHPEFGEPTPPSPSDTYVLTDINGNPIIETLLPGVFQMPTNSVTNTIGEFRLPVLEAAVTIDVFESTAAGERNPVDNYTVDLDFTDDTDAANDFSVTQTSSGPLTVPGLRPGVYDLTISATDRFSFISTVVVGRTETENAVVAVIEAPLPSVGATIEGQIVALNINAEPVALPAVTVTRTFGGALGRDPGEGLGGSVTADGSSAELINTNPFGEMIIATDVAADVAADADRFTFPETNQVDFTFSNNVAFGTQSVSVATNAGWTVSDSQTILVDGTGVFDLATEIPDFDFFVLEANNVDVVVDITAESNGTFTEDLFSATLTTASGVVRAEMVDPAPAFSVVGGVATATVTFKDVPPSSSTGYALRVEDPMYNGTQTDPTTGPTAAELVLVPAATTSGDPRAVVESPSTPSVAPVRGVVAGVVTRDGTALANTVVGTLVPTVVPPGGVQPISVSTDQDGRFEVGAGPDDYVLTISNGLNATIEVRDPVTVTLGERNDVGTIPLVTLVTFEVSTTPSLPADATVVMEQQSTGDIFEQQPAGSLTFYLPANSDYKVIVAGSYPRTEYPGKGNNDVYPVGDATVDGSPATDGRLISLPRAVEVITNNPPAGLQVVLGAETQNAVDPAVEPLDGSVVFTPQGNGTLDLLLRVGPGDSDVIISTTVQNRTGTILEFNFVDLSGALTVSDGVTIPVGTDITASSNGTTLTGAVTAGNGYLIEGLTANANGSNRTWTLAFAEAGYGTINTTTSISIEDDSDPSRDLPATITPREFTVTFNVVGIDGLPVSDNEITFNGSTNSASASSKVFSGVRETQRNLDYSVVNGNGSLTGGGTIASVIANDAEPVALEQAPLTGNVSGLTGIGPDTTVQICPSTPVNDLDAACASPETGVALDGVGDFSTTALSAGSYFVEVRRLVTSDPVTGEAVRAFTVNADGSVTVGAFDASANATAWTIAIFGESP
jgi:hypothetical protein